MRLARGARALMHGAVIHCVYVCVCVCLSLCVRTSVRACAHVRGQSAGSFSDVAPEERWHEEYRLLSLAVEPASNKFVSSLAIKEAVCRYLSIQKDTNTRAYTHTAHFLPLE